MLMIQLIFAQTIETNTKFNGYDHNYNKAYANLSPKNQHIIKIKTLIATQHQPKHNIKVINFYCFD